MDKESEAARVPELGCVGARVCSRYRSLTAGIAAHALRDPVLGIERGEVEQGSRERPHSINAAISRSRAVRGSAATCGVLLSDASRRNRVAAILAEHTSSSRKTLSIVATRSSSEPSRGYPACHARLAAREDLTVQLLDGEAMILTLGAALLIARTMARLSRVAISSTTTSGGFDATRAKAASRLPASPRTARCSRRPKLVLNPSR